MAAASAREFFEGLAERTRHSAARTRGLRATYRFDVEGAGSWRVEVDDGAVSVSESDAAADCVIAVPEQLFLRIVRGILLKGNGWVGLLMNVLKVILVSWVAYSAVHGKMGIIVYAQARREVAAG